MAFPTPLALHRTALGVVAVLLLLGVHAEKPASVHAHALVAPHERVPVRAEAARDIQPLSEAHLRLTANQGPPEWTSTEEGHLGRILIPRARGRPLINAAGTKNSTLVQEYISGVMTKLGWHEAQTPFEWDTPIGPTKFNNLIYTFNPDAPRRIVIAAHFDSKYFPSFPQNQFLGATDSAAPCAFMLDLAEAMTPALRARDARIQSGEAILREGFDEEEAAETTLQLIFLDGEEAIKDWTDTDSIYGARYLAQTWADEYLAPSHLLSQRKRRFEPTPSVLNTINVFVLLDLLGHRSPRIRSYYRETDWMHQLMASADERLRAAGLVEVERGEEGWFDFSPGYKGQIGDDHVPFLDRGVSILHIISTPFPNVWHTLGDDASALSIPAMNRWNKILRVFTAEYMGLEPATSNDERADGAGVTSARAQGELVSRPSIKSAALAEEQ